MSRPALLTLALLLCGCAINEKQPVVDKTILFEGESGFVHFNHIKGEASDVYHLADLPSTLNQK